LPSCMGHGKPRTRVTLPRACSPCQGRCGSMYGVAPRETAACREFNGRAQRRPTARRAVDLLPKGGAQPKTPAPHAVEEFARKLQTEDGRPQRRGAVGEAKQREESRSVIALTPARVRGRQRGKGVVHTTGLGSSLRDPSRQHGEDRVPKKLGGVEISKLTKLAGSPITSPIRTGSSP